jgi:hypothetical protein
VDFDLKTGYYNSMRKNEPPLLLIATILTSGSFLSVLQYGLTCIAAKLAMKI